MYNYELSRFIIHVKDYKKSVPAEKENDVKIPEYRVCGIARVDCTFRSHGLIVLFGRFYFLFFLEVLLILINDLTGFNSGNVPHRTRHLEMQFI